jgi:hypothetical protein
MRSILLTITFLLFSFLSNCNSNPWITPADTSAGALDAKVVVLDFPTSSDGKNIVVMQFSAGGKPVKFAAGETVTCNGVPLPLNELMFGYAERVPIVPVGGSYHFVYTRSGVPTSINQVVPPRVVFTSPTAGATVTRSNNLTITYVADAGTGINASGSGPAGNLNRNVFQPDNGTYTGLDTSTFGAGPGEVSLERRFEGPISGTAFHSASRQYNSWSRINVNWN